MKRYWLMIRNPFTNEWARFSTQPITLEGAVIVWATRLKDKKNFKLQEDEHEQASGNNP